MSLEMWHCPNCGAPQAEAARCWVCRRSSTTCSTCTHFRRALAGDIGYCGLDAKRRPLTGREQRGCWELGPSAAAEAQQTRSVQPVERHRLRGGRSAPRTADPGGPPSRDFVPIESLTARRTTPAELPAELAADQPVVESPAVDAPPAFVIEPEPAWGERTSLFGDREG
jgi:hypothetical protein